MGRRGVAAPLRSLRSPDEVDLKEIKQKEAH